MAELSNYAMADAELHLWYVLPVGNFTSGHAHASANDTTRVSPAGTDVDAATAAPTDDPGLDAAAALGASPLKKPFCCTVSLLSELQMPRFFRARIS